MLITSLACNAIAPSDSFGIPLTATHTLFTVPVSHAAATHSADLRGSSFGSHANSMLLTPICAQLITVAGRECRLCAQTATRPRTATRTPSASPAAVSAETAADAAPNEPGTPVSASCCEASGPANPTSATRTPPCRSLMAPCSSGTSRPDILTPMRPTPASAQRAARGSSCSSVIASVCVNRIPAARSDDNALPSKSVAASTDHVTSSARTQCLQSVSWPPPRGISRNESISTLLTGEQVPA